MSNRSKLRRKPEGDRGKPGVDQSESRVQIIRYRSSPGRVARVIGFNTWPNARVLGTKTPQGLSRNKRRQKIRLSLSRTILFSSQPPEPMVQPGLTFRHLQQPGWRLEALRRISFQQPIK